MVYKYGILSKPYRVRHTEYGILSMIYKYSILSTVYKYGILSTVYKYGLLSKEN